MAQVPRLPPQVLDAAAQVKPLQQAPAPAAEQSAFWQQDCPAPPHATSVPALHTWVPTLVPDGTHWPEAESRQPPAWQVLPAHGGWNAPPQPVHVPLVHMSPIVLQRLPGQHI